MKRLDYEDLQEGTYRAIEEKILTWELRVNEKLGQKALAGRLGGSRTPPLRMFSKLEQGLFVVEVPRRGFFVRQFSDEELVAMYDIRQRLEPSGSFEPAERSINEGVRRIEELSRAFSAAIKRNQIQSIKAAGTGTTPPAGSRRAGRAAQ